MRPTGRWGRRISPQDLWAYRELALMLALRNLQLRYRHTLVGVGWVWSLSQQPPRWPSSRVFGHLADVRATTCPLALEMVARWQGERRSEALEVGCVEGLFTRHWRRDARPWWGRTYPRWRSSVPAPPAWTCRA